MATIVKRQLADGTASYTAQIRLKRSGKVVHSEAQTFDKATAAKAWATRREAELAQPGALQAAAGAGMTLSALIDTYVAEFFGLHGWRRSKATHLDFLKRQPIGAADASAITAQVLVDHVRRRRLEGAGPSTVGNDLTWIGVVLKAGKHVFGLNVDAHAADDARLICRQHRLVAKSKRRERRPSAEELARLMRRFDGKDGRQKIPMQDIIMFAVHSARREAEITRLLWSDLNERHSTILVRDVKHPTRRAGNNRVSKLTPEAMAIIKRQKKVAPEIFPYNSKSIGTAFTRACQILGIEDLCFHDMRHEATSRLFERGYSIPEVALFTLHESWQELKRYTQIQPQQVKLLPASGRSIPQGRERKRARVTSGRRGGAP